MWAVPHHHDHSGAGLSVSVISTPLLSLTSPLTFDAIIMIRWVKIFIPFKQSNSKWHTEITCDNGKFTQFHSAQFRCPPLSLSLSLSQLIISMPAHIGYLLHNWRLMCALSVAQRISRCSVTQRTLTMHSICGSETDI